MDYFDILNFKREPFSNSPDPDFFYQSGQHTGCLQQLELAVRLKRGLNVVIGHVGTGKTTLCRELIRRLDGDGHIDTHLMLDPGMRTDSAFLSAVVGHFSGNMPPANGNDDQKKETIKQFLFAQGVQKDRTTVLIIDEGQKITPSCLEILREFLNYETNTHKLLQIVIFAQQEFDHIIAAHPNFRDRINLRLELKPLGLRDTTALIRYRVDVSGGGSASRLFSLPALVAIYRATQGYPRRIIHLCHRILLTLIIQNRRRAGWRLVRASVRRTAVAPRCWRWRWPVAAGAAILIAAMLSGPARWLESSDVPFAGSAAAIHAPIAAAPTQTDASKFQRQTAALDSPLPPSRSDTPPPAPARSSSPMAAAAGDPKPAVGNPPMLAPMPARLGRLTIRPSETLGELIQTIYGQFAPSYLDAVGEANPHIGNPDTLEVGDVIHFPAIPAEIRPPAVDVWWVQLAVHRHLEDALRELQRIERRGTAARLIPYWNPEQGLIFALVLRACFYDERVADHALTMAGPVLYPDARIQAFQSDATVFFSNPFQETPVRNSNRS
jgi:general secretion pathway protein A